MMSTGIVGAMAITIAPVVNRISEIIIVFFLPKKSAQGPPRMDPTAAPKVARDTIVYKKALSDRMHTSFWTSVISGQVSAKWS